MNTYSEYIRYCVNNHLFFFFLSYFRDIRPGGIFKSKIICHPKKAGEKKIIAQLNSLQVKGISVEKIIIITE